MSDTADEALPAVAEDPREMIRVQPAGDGLNPRTARTHFRRLHDFLSDSNGRFRRPTRETLEIRLTSREGQIHYDIGLEDQDRLDSLERLLRGLFPNTYEFTRTASTDHELYTTEADPVGIEFEGRPERRDDWQTQLKTQAFFAGDDREHTRLPLTAVAETLAGSTHPVVVQILLTPRPDWTATAEARSLDIESQQDTAFAKVLNSVIGQPDPEDLSLSASDHERLEELRQKDSRHCFDVAARAVSLPRADGDTAQANAVIEDLETAFSTISHTS